ncbi:hypothetical protein DL769_009989 [Monosporascus sp. CRB-8-3]|nr:hypothetical protein DL769_009989 [Monosporascus sp. CRB-8-3]
MRNNSQSESTRTTSSSSIPRFQIAPDAGSPHLDRGMTASPVELQSSQNVETSHASTQPTKIYPELDRYRDIQHMPASRGGHSIDVPFRLATHDLPPPTPLFSGNSSHSQLSMFSASPSTKYSESPGTGPYSRDTTPTSISSQSPGLVAPMRFPVPRVRQASPAETRPPVTRRRTGSVSNEADAYSADPHGLAAVSEALTSSSSSSTVRIEEKKGKEKRQGLLEAPPNPPARKSSQKLRKGLITKESPSKSLQKPARPLAGSPSPTKLMHSPRSKSEGLVVSPQPRLSPPSRPSRDGMPDLYSQFGGPMPIIHSNLSSSSLTDRRLSSHLSPSSFPRAATPASSQDRSIIPSSSLRREPTPTPRPNALQNAEPARQEPARMARSPSPNVSTLRSRFPIFGRRTKTASEGTQGDKKQKPTRKGPAAGTGHEGYGRIGAVKRRSSNTSILGRGLPGPLSSSDSLASVGSMDPFLLERMNPVIIAGGEVVENRNTSSELLRTESNQSIPFAESSVASQNNSSVSLPSRDEARQTLWPSALPRTRRPSDSSDSEALTMKPTIAFRRSTQRGRSPDKPLNIPKPIMTRTIRPPSIGSIATIILTDSSLPDPRPAVAYKKEELSTGPKKLTKRAKSPRKWTLFGRSHSPPAANVKKVGADVSQAVKSEQGKTVAYYTLMDSSEQEDTEEQDVGAILRETGALKVPQSGSGTRERSAPLNSQSQGVAPPHLQPARDVSPVRPERSPVREQVVPQPGHLKPTIRHTPSNSVPERPSRLPHVGRIPKVVNTRPKQSSPKSFSRPFHRLSLQRRPTHPVPIDDDSVAKGPSPPRPLSPDSAYGESSAVAGANKTNIEDQGPPGEPSTGFCQPEKEFLSLSPRHDSECTTSSTSGSSGMIGHANHVAVLPGPSAPPGEDEVWDEYNDLLGDVPPSATSSHGLPFHLETYETKLAKMSSKPLESPTIRNERSKDVRGSTETGKTARSSSHYSAEMTARINAAFRFGSDQPNTPLSLSEFVSGYGDRNNDKSGDQEGNAPVTSKRSSSCSNRSRRTKANSCSSRSSEDTPLSQVNLRVGSMTVSKWLTFGHVLFSPARDDLINAVGSLKRHSILVIDGLGNDDWSFYAAETYPAATFFNLSPRAPIPQDQKSSPSFPLSPPNHHQIQYTSHKDKFPFGPDSFTSVVFRFPAAAPEAYYRNIIAEAWRVLKPGGYIELSILDVDLNNMGNRTRRAVRRLKERVAAQNPDFNLSSTADLILRLLGKRGFTDVKTCRVGVPVASPITKSGGKDGGKKDERSLAEMMNDETEAGDENIGKMVSKVGRWWYNRCYEVPAGVNRSIWNDRALLAECEEWGTSLKLMVCHARIPESRGRVASI